MGRKVLPFDVNAIITSYPHYSFMCSLIQTKPHGKEWIYQTYTQIVGYWYQSLTGADAKLNFYPWAGMSDGDLWNLCPYIDKMTVPRQYLLEREDHIGFIKEWIDQGWYLSMYIDEFFREDIQQLGVYYHPLFIFGYDDDKQVIYGADCFENWVYGIKEISYADFSLASKTSCYTSQNSSQYAIQLYTLKDHIIDHFSLPFFRQQLMDYYNCELPDYYLQTQYPDKRWRYSKQLEDCSYVLTGIAAYNVLLNIIDDVYMENYNWNIKFMLTPDFRLLRDRSEIMVERYIFLQEKLHVPFSKELTDLLNQQVQRTKIMENLLLKYVLSQKKGLLEKLRTKLEEFIQQEQIITLKLLEITGGKDDKLICTNK